MLLRFACENYLSLVTSLFNYFSKLDVWNILGYYCCCCLVAKLCLTLVTPGSFIHGISRANILFMSCHFLLWKIFLTQGLNLHLLHWQTDSLPLSHLGNPSVDFHIFDSVTFSPWLPTLYAYLTDIFFISMT